jgi:hypothetical protein
MLKIAEELLKIAEDLIGSEGEGKGERRRMRIQIIGKDRFNVIIRTEDGEIVRIQRYPTTSHAAWRQIEFYQEILKGERIGEIIEIEDPEYIKTIERAIARQDTGIIDKEVLDV